MLPLDKQLSLERKILVHAVQEMFIVKQYVNLLVSQLQPAISVVVMIEMLVLAIIVSVKI